MSTIDLSRYSMVLNDMCVVTYITKINLFIITYVCNGISNLFDIYYNIIMDYF